ncbi:MAG TPA: DoxX family protein [Burkholderiales bacterium]|nr:DoxX family protein [Burkholderiales bacterium]
MNEAIDPRTKPYAILLLRIALGAMWISHAMLKIFVFTLPGTAAFFEAAGLPGLLVYPVVAAEIAGGIAIATGFQGRVVSVLLLPILLTAAWVHFPNGWVFSAKGGGWEYPVFLAVASVVHALAGDGAWSLKLPRLHFARLAT